MLLIADCPDMSFVFALQVDREIKVELGDQLASSYSLALKIDFDDVMMT